jgi:hypothetical protein
MYIFKQFAKGLSSMRKLFTLLTLLLAMSLIAPTVAAQDASPAASPTGECVSPEIPPGTPTPMEAEASPDAAMAATPAENEGPPPAEASPEMPVGEIAPADVTAAIEATIANFADCYNAGDYVGLAALHTPEGLMDECGTGNVYDGPMCFGGTPTITSIVVSDVQTHEDGRVSADVVAHIGSFLSHERFFLVMDDDGTYLVDETPDLPVDVPEGATMIDGEMADYEFILSATSAPAGDIAFNLTNTGEYPHEMVAVMLPEGITIEDVFADESLFGQVQFMGFTFAEPGQVANPLVLVDVQPGIYTMVCFVDVPEGVPHVMRGMIIEFEVTE